jgi:hypothetical protein
MFCVAEFFEKGQASVPEVLTPPAASTTPTVNSNNNNNSSDSHSNSRNIYVRDVKVDRAISQGQFGMSCQLRKEHGAC